MNASRRSVCAWMVAGLACGSAAAQVTVPADLIARTGNVLPGSGGVAVTSLGVPRVSPSGGVAFTGMLADQRAFLCVDGQVVWTAPLSPPAEFFGSLETGYGVAAGAFVVSPLNRSPDLLITESGTIATTGGEIPGSPGLFWDSFYRPTITGDGAMVFANSRGSGAWSIWSRTGAGVFSRRLGTGDVVNGFTLGAVMSSDAGYAVSPDGQRLGAIVFGPTGQSLLIDGQLRAGYGSPTGSPVGDAWRAHWGLVINNVGDYLHSGRTTATASNDYVLAYNGRVRARSLDSIGTRDAVPALAQVAGAGLTGNGIAMFVWGAPGFLPLYAGHAPVLRWRSVTVVKGGDRLDTTGDGVAEWTLATVNPEGVARGLEADSQWRVPLRATLIPLPGSGSVSAIVRVAIPVGYRRPGDFNHDGRVDPSDVAEMVRDWMRDVGTGIATTDYDLSDTPTPGDVTGFLQVWFGAVGGGCG